MFKSFENLSWDDIAEVIAGKGTTEKLSTGATIAGGPFFAKTHARYFDAIGLSRQAPLNSPIS